jgi:hypothetical protein
MVLTVFGPNREEEIVDWRILISEALCNLYSSPKTSSVILSRIMVWAGHDACIGSLNAYNLKEDATSEA